jgi:hypothetical protein
MTDKERILLWLVQKLSRAATKRKEWGVWMESGFCFSSPEPGDLVICETARSTHEWIVGWYVKRLHDGAQLRELGTDRLCNVTNESFGIIRGVDRSQNLELLEGWQHRFACKVRRWFWREHNNYGSWYGPTFSHIEFPEQRLARIWVRARFGGSRAGEQMAIPYSFDMRFSSRTTCAQIADSAKAAGYPSREFEYGPPKSRCSTIGVPSD